MSDDRAERELIRLWLLANEGSASPAELDQLNQMLETDPRARQAVFQLSGQQGWLLWNGVREPGLASGALSADSSNLEAVGVEESRAGQEGVHNQPSRIGKLASQSREAIKRLSHARIPLVSYRMAALVAGIALFGALSAQQLSSLPIAQTFRPSGDVRAEMVGATVCVWNGGREAPPSLGHQFHDGDTLQLLEGVAELRVVSLTSTADLQLEGPAAIVIGANGISNLRYGKVAIETSRTGSGFQVATSFGRVVAGPGAEIGISTFGNSAEVHVFDGIVALESPWIVSTDGELAVQHISAGSAVRLTQSGESSFQVANIAPDRGLFTTRLSMDANFLAVKPSYVKAILEAKPAAYWRFEEADGNRVRNEMGDHFVGELRGDFRWVGPNGNRALELGVAPNPGLMRVTDSWDEVLAKDFSFELWMRPSHYHVGTIIGFVGEFDSTVRKNPYGLAVEIQGGWGNGSMTNRVRFLNRSPLSMITPGTSLYSGRRYAPRRWQHVVAIREGDRLRLYLDGDLVQTGRFEAKTPEGMQLIVGQLFSDAVDRPFIGYLDEVAIYDRALGEQEVEEHYRLIRSEAKSQESI